MRLRTRPHYDGGCPPPGRPSVQIGSGRSNSEPNELTYVDMDTLLTDF